MISQPNKSTQQISLEMLQTNGSFDINKFFEFSFYEGTPLYRFVDEMQVDWNEIAKKIGRSPEECKAQYQFLLDTLFQKEQFSKTDRETLYKIITGSKKYNYSNKDEKKVPIPEETLKEIQELYFPDYSTEVLMIEILAVLDNFKKFVSESKPQ